MSSQRLARTQRKGKQASERAASWRAARCCRAQGHAAGIVAVLVVALIAVNASSAHDDASGGLPIIVPAAQRADVPVDGRIKGNADAPVQVIEYDDYQCPACGVFGRDQERQLDEAQFTSCIDSDLHEDTVKASLADGRERRVASTPSVHVNGTLITGTNYPAICEAISTP